VAACQAGGDVIDDGQQLCAVVLEMAAGLTQHEHQAGAAIPTAKPHPRGTSPIKSIQIGPGKCIVRFGARLARVRVGSTEQLSIAANASQAAGHPSRGR
jgi:hypothetical protein